MKKQSNLSRLLEIAGSHKYLTYASWVLSAISALIALVPFYYIWKNNQRKYWRWHQILARHRT